ncbi:MAG: FAD-dependent oxidoreductase [Cyanobacteria bacterium P01_F01_bin.3]
MAADYDLVILGGTLEGRCAALSAANYGARVALVEPPSMFLRRQQAKYLLKGLQQLGEGKYRQAVGEWFELSGESRSRSNGAANFDWPGLLRWSVIAAETQQPEVSVDALSVAGVDVVFAQPEHLARQLVVIVAGRQLSTRSVLAAFGSVPLPVFGAYASAPALTGIEPLLNVESLPKSIDVWGESFEAVEWSQALNAVGVSVSLVADRFLPDEDSEVRGWVRTQLRATGIQLMCSAEMVANSDVQLKSSVGGASLLHPSLMLGPTKPALTLPAFAYSANRRCANAEAIDQTCLSTNQYLQTAHRRIFACGSVRHKGFVEDSVAQSEAQTAVWNALFVPNRKVLHHVVPHSHHRFARVGLTPRFAKEGYTPTGDYSTMTASTANSADLSQPLPLPEYCKLICKKGRLQSVHLLGDGAAQLAELIPGMIGKPIHQLLNSSTQTLPVTKGLARLIHIAASKSHQTQWQPGHWRRDWAENWFNWRRSRKN